MNPNQVAWHWQLDSCVIFKALNFLDYYLARHEVEELEL